MIKEHLDKIIEIGEEPIGYVGNNSLKWAASVWPDSLVVDKGLDKRFDRYSLAAYCDNVLNNDVDVVLAILSWGGMKREHGRALYKDFDSLLPLVRLLRKRGFSTRGSFRCFS